MTIAIIIISVIIGGLIGVCYYFLINGNNSIKNPNPELKKQWIEKACEWLQKNDSYSKPTELQVRDFRKYMEDEL